MISFDDILEKKIRTGSYQFKTLGIIGLVEFCDGIEYAYMSILVAIIQKEWELNQQQIASLGSSFLLGMVIGNCICAFITDIIGRKTTFTIFTGLSVFLIYFTSICTSYNQMITLRLMFGIVFGTSYPLGYVFISEVTEPRYRGRFGYSMGVLFVIGKIYLAFLCIFYLNDFTSGNWRGLIRVNGIPVAISFILSLFFLKETVRYYLNSREYKVAFDLIDSTIQENQREPEILTEEEKQGLMNWQEKQIQINQEQELNKFGILSQNYKYITIKIWILYILANLQNMSIYLLMPFLFANNNSNLSSMLFMFILELIFALLLYVFIDDPNIGGRKMVIGYSSLILVLANASLYIFREHILFFGLLLIKLACRALFSTLGLVCCESYPLQLRAQGTAIAFGIGKTASIPSPFFLFPLFYLDPYLPFALMSVLSIIMIITNCLIGEDKTMKPLESHKEE
ncbi:unnamed protein product (macronuclear) [Paramecium tetraurelia]|uniref:Major facilitator superfamily (MFS) profile domain-containing protein n=1 Tax=Paramecium tetraurelia TaxID=5888 RepID=A0DFM6_PARTE|nr:uncharacterized protein GSPATT00016656001 [Paramecium tetraurelia]CAK81843.1 unnamed protein product [Paramecium tetraurelia]|eukprot:XP_001449240.1 hypothetical protein (macronuclear) [Paramecium tetraurelia strain d4-2]